VEIEKYMHNYNQKKLLNKNNQKVKKPGKILDNNKSILIQVIAI